MKIPTILLLLSTITPPNQPTTVPFDEMTCVVAGEAGAWDAQLFIAMQLLQDYYRGVTLRDRWYGWRCGSEQAARAVRLAFVRYPLYSRCRFVGSLRDAATWRARGWVGPDDRADYVFSGPVLAFGCE